MKKIIPKGRGFAPLFLVLGGLIIIVIAVTSVVWLGRTPTEPAAENSDNQTRPNEVQPPVKSQIVWGNVSPGTYERVAAPKSQTAETISFSGRGTAVLKVITKDPKITVELKDNVSQPVAESAVVQKTVSQNPNGETTVIFTVKSQAVGTTKDWQLVINNPNTQTPANYQLIVSEGAQVSANSATDNASDASTNLSLTLEETISLNVTVPVIDATVVANITDPNGETTTVVLVEDPNNPGTYTGTFNDVDTPGTYEITYVISGSNSDGEHFDQVVTDQFDVPDPNVGGNDPEPNPVYQTNKKYDINQGDDIRPVY